MSGELEGARRVLEGLEKDPVICWVVGDLLRRSLGREK